MAAVDVAVHDRVAYAVINRPDRRNAVDQAVLEGLEHASEVVRDDPTVRALVLMGAGESFSVGMDLEVLDRAFADHAYFRFFLERFHLLLLGLESLPVPVVAAVGGLTRAGGLEIVLACDLVLVAAEARIADHHLAFGVVPGAGASQRAPRLGDQRARELIFTSRWLTGAEAVEVGLALRCVPRRELGPAVEDLVAQLRGKSRPCLAATKSAMRAGAGLPLDQAVWLELEQFMTYLEDVPDSDEGYRAWIEHRDPTWAS